MKRNVIAILLSISLIAGSFGAVPSYAAEVTAQEGITENEQGGASVPSEDELSASGEEEAAPDVSSQSAEGQSVENEPVGGEEQIISNEIEEPGNGITQELDENEITEEGLPDEEAIGEEAGSAASDVDTEMAAVVEPTVESTKGKEAALEGETSDIVASGSCGENATWKLTGTENQLTFTVSGSGDMYNYDYSQNPWFDYRNNIETVVIEEGITAIGDFSFYECVNMINIIIPSSVTSIGRSVFSNCRSLPGITLPEGVTSIGDYAFEACKGFTNFTIPYGVKDIGENTFAGCENMISIEIPEGVTSIGNMSFYSCSSLTSVTIPEGVTSIGSSAFQYCSSLTSVTIPTGVTKISNGVFYNCTNLTSITIPDRVTSIGDSAFSSCSSLTSINIPTSVTSIGSSAFSYCSSLISIEIPEGVTSIGSHTFNSCGNLTNIIIPDSVTSIERGAFSYCSNLTSIKIPDGVTELGYQAFIGCNKIEKIYINSVEAWLNLNLYGNTLYGELYLNGKPLTSAVIPEGITNIRFSAFRGCSSLKEIIFPDSLRSIDSDAFLSCNNITELVFPEGLESIGSQAFRYCKKLRTITVPGSITEIDDLAFEDDSGIRAWYTVPGSYLTTHYPRYGTVYYLCDENTTEQYHIGFITDSITVMSGEAFDLNEYLVTNLNLDECTVSLSNESNFIYDDGIVASIGAGVCNITVSNGKKFATATIVAQDETIGLAEDITFDDSEITIVKGQTVSNTLSITPINANIDGFEWSSSDETVVTVNKGRITAIGAGTAIVTVMNLDNNDINAVCTVTVSVPLNDIIVIDSSIEIEKGKTQSIRLYKYPSDTTDEIIYSSKDDSVASVDQYGRVSANDFGTTVIIATSGEISKEIEVTVYRPLSGISLDKTSAQLGAGETLQLNVAFEPEDATEIEVTWISSKETVATVDEQGLVTAHGKGIARITVIAGDYSAYCTIVCPSISLTGIELPENQIIEYGEEYIPVITYLPSTTTDDKTATWESSNPDIFTVSEEGIVTPTGIGTATLTATVSEFSAISEITVIKGTPEYETPEAINAVCGQTLTELELPEGFEWNDAEQGVGNAGSNSFIVSFTPEDTDHYNTVDDITVVVNVSHEYAEEWTEGDDTHWHECACGEIVDETEHIYGEWEVTTEPTCTESGEKQRICTECGHVDKDTIAAKGHDWFADYTVDADATCVDAGEKSIYCKDCGEKKEGSTVDIPPLGHVYAEKVIQPTCSQGGFTMHICGRCGDYYEDTETQPTGHSFGDWIIDNDSTCTEEGIRHRECADCGYIETKGINKIDHSFDTEFTVDKEPTCTTDGSRSYHCTSEGCTATTGCEVIPATGHDYSDWTVTREATCTENGEMERTCGVCDETETVEFGARGHVWLKVYTVDQEATCTEEGSESIHCAECDAINEETVRAIPKKEHAYGDWTVIKEATCTEAGSKEKVCADCGDKVTEETPAKGHSWKEEYTVDQEATCTEEGSESIHCAECDAINEATIRAIPKKEHAYGDWTVTKEATCTEAGSREKVCADCGETDTVEIPALGHLYGGVVIEPTCTTGGYTTHVCGRCGDSYIDHETTPTGHSFGDWIIDNDSTCTEEGIQHRECENCGYTETKGINKKEHSFDTEYTVDKEPTCTTDGSKSYHCTSEGCTATTGSEVIPATGHVYGDWTVTREATCTESGEMERTCEVCDETETVEFGARGHVWLKIPTVDLEATCTEEGSESVRCAVCDEIKEGSERVIPAKGHMLIHVEAVEPTYESDGSIEYYRCEQCSLLFEDENCENEIRVEDTVIPALEWISVSQVSLDKNEITINRSVKEQLEATVSPENATDKRVIWESSDENVAKVDENGEVTGIGFGDAVITVTAKDGGISAQCTVHVVSRIRIVTQPDDRNAEPGERVSFKVEAEGSELSYQWQWSTSGTTWKNCTSASYNTDTFSFVMKEKFAGRRYRCVITGEGEVIETSAAVLSMKQEERIIVQPADAEAESGETVSFHIEFDGADASYRWQWSADGNTWRNCLSDGCNTDTFSFEMSERFAGRKYRCVVKDDGRTYISDAAELKLGNSLKIIQQPEDVTVPGGQNAFFHVEASGNDLIYQWQWSADGTTWKSCTISSYNTDTFSFRTKAAYNGRMYRCKIKSGSNSIVSDSAELTVTQ